MSERAAYVERPDHQFGTAMTGDRATFPAACGWVIGGPPIRNAPTLMAEAGGCSCTMHEPMGREHAAGESVPWPPWFNE